MFQFEKEHLKQALCSCLQEAREPRLFLVEEQVTHVFLRGNRAYRVLLVRYQPVVVFPGSWTQPVHLH